MAVIRYLNSRAPAGASLGDVAGSVPITRSHCHNILRTLVSCRWVGYDQHLRLYSLRSALVEDVSAALNSAEPVSALRPIMVRLTGEVGLACVLSRPEPDGSFIVVDKVEGTLGLGLAVPIGYKFPSDAPVQRKAVLAWASKEEIASWIRGWKPVAYTRSSIVTKQKMRAELAATRRRGFARSDCEYIDGILSIGLPIFDGLGKVVMLLHCPGLEATMRAREKIVARALRRAVADAHAILGGRIPAGFPGPHHTQSPAGSPPR